MKKHLSEQQITAFKEMDDTERTAVAGAALLAFATTMGAVLMEETFHSDLHEVKNRQELIDAFDQLYVRIRHHQAYTHTIAGHEAPEARRRRASTVALEFTGGQRLGRSRAGSFLEEPEEPEVEDETATAGLVWTGRFAGGLVRDWRRRVQTHYKSDWQDSLSWSILAPVVFIYMATLAPTIAFGGLLQQVTGDSMGMTEIIVGQAAVGMVFAIVGGQGLTILRPTGPVVAYIAVVYAQSVIMDVNFLVLWAWVGLWTMVWLALVAVFDVAVLVRYVTDFTEDVYNALIGTIFIVEAARHAILYISDPNDQLETVAVLSVALLLLTHVLCMACSTFNTSKYMNHAVRDAITVAGPLLAMVATTTLAWLMKGRFWSSDKIANLVMLDVPDTLAPTQAAFNATAAGCVDCRRPWIVPFVSEATGEIVGWGALMGFMLALLFFLEQNITVMLMNKESNRLVKGTAYHYDMLWVALLVGVCAIFGLPVAHASLPHSVLHLQAHAKHGEAGDLTQSGVHREIASVRDNRLSAFLVNLMIGLSALFLPVLGVIPLPVVFGLFLYMGIESLVNNRFFQRVTLLFTQPRLYPPDHVIRHMRPAKVHWFTILQFCCLGAIWLVKGASQATSVFFPVVVWLMLPLRHRWLPGVFGSRDVGLLDEHITDEDAGHETHAEHELMTVS